MTSAIKKPNYLLRGMVVWFVIIFVESLHGTARELLLKPIVGDFRARQIAVFSGMVLIFSVAYFFVRWLATENTNQLLKIGFMWLLLTLAFEFSLGRLLGFSWQRLWEDYDLTRGGLMGFGLLFLLFTPMLAAKTRSNLNRRDAESAEKNRQD